MIFMRVCNSRAYVTLENIWRRNANPARDNIHVFVTYEYGVSQKNIATAFNLRIFPSLNFQPTLTCIFAIRLYINAYLSDLKCDFISCSSFYSSAQPYFCILSTLFHICINNGINQQSIGFN